MSRFPASVAFAAWLRTSVRLHRHADTSRQAGRSSAWLPSGWQRRLLALGVLGALSGSAFAAEPSSAPRGPAPLPIDPALLTHLPERGDVVPWHVLAQVRVTEDGGSPLREFSSELRKLDGQDVRVQGYMLPITAGETHDRFLLSMRPPECPLCIALDPRYLIDVRAAAGIPQTEAVLVLAGRLELLHDSGSGLYYRLTGARLAPSTR